MFSMSLSMIFKLDDMIYVWVDLPLYWATNRSYVAFPQTELFHDAS